QAYLARLAQFARQIDQETQRVSHDAAQHVIAPDFILDAAIQQISALRQQSAADTQMAKSLSTRATALHIAGEWAAQAARIVSGQIYPAIDRQIAALRAARTRAQHDAGVWRLPQGEAYYAWLLKVGTSTNLTADEVHTMGLEQGRAIDARMD